MKIKVKIFKETPDKTWLRVNKVLPYYYVLCHHVDQGGKISAVKLIKEATGLGLKESKDILDKFEVLYNENKVKNEED